MADSGIPPTRTIESQWQSKVEKKKMKWMHLEISLPRMLGGGEQENLRPRHPSPLHLAFGWEISSVPDASRLWMRVLQHWVLCSLHPRLQSFSWPYSPVDGWPARDQLRPVAPHGSQPPSRYISLVIFYLTPYWQAQNFFLRKLSLADRSPTRRCEM
jgi:hypothetical protein